VEIIDHHRIDAVETINPIYFRAQPLGCTSTIVSMMFRENHIEIEPTIAGLMCSAIISDTLMFRSPTCTPADEAAARMLASIAGIDIEEYAIAMFNAGSNLGDKTPDEIFHLDCKKFKATSASIYVAQITSVSANELEQVRERLIPYMEGLLPQSGAEMLFLMLTNIIDESTCLVFVGKGSKGVVRAAFDDIEDLKNNSALLPGVVSRKKQIVAPLITAIDEM
jgi:manganese-dependent inorganic pyrophosphatase